MQQYLNKKNVFLIVIGFISILIIISVGVLYQQYKKTGKEGNININCNDRCLSLEYISGICRGWAVSANEEMQCESYEKGIGETKDCQSETAEIKSECCCRTEQSIFSPPTP